MTSIRPQLLILISILGLFSCTNENIIQPDHVIVHLPAEPQQLNPMNANDANAPAIFYGIFQELVNADFQTMTRVPVLAKSLPIISKIEDSDLIAMDFEIRSEAAWDNNTPVTGYDVEFSLKAIKAPKTNCYPRKGLFEFVKNIIIDEENPKKFTLITEAYMLLEDAISDLPILPKHIYDPENLLESTTLEDLSNPDYATILAEDENLNTFAQNFNSPTFQREIIKGSGPYELASWQTGQRIILKKKDNWWGNSIEDDQWFQAYPDTIIYEVINDPSVAMLALKNGEINTMFSIPPKIFVEQTDQEEFNDKFHTFTPPMYAYDFIGINLNNPKFSDVNTRKGLAHLMDRNRLIEEAHFGFAQTTDCFSHPSNKDQLSPNIQPYDFNIEKAKEYLAQAGWKDTDDDGILDQVIDGKLTPLTINLVTHAENDRRIAATQIFKEGAEEVGIEVMTEIKPWNAFLQQIFMQRSFELFVSGWGASPFENDPMQLWHSKSVNSSNLIGYSNPKVDQSIDAMRKEIDPNARLPHYHFIHEQIHNDIPYIFLTTQKERIAVSNKFENVWGTGMRPGFWAAGFTLR